MIVSDNRAYGLIILKTWLFFIFLLQNIPVSAQMTNDKAEMMKIMAAVDSFRNRVPAEKLFLHFDKPYYVSGDTLWFKAYLFEKSFLTASSKSGICYLEIANDLNQLIKRIMLPVVGGLSWGQIALTEKEFPEGAYILRAYTNLMRNFGEDLIFKKQINIYKSPVAAFSFNTPTNVNPSIKPENRIKPNPQTIANNSGIVLLVHSLSSTDSLEITVKQTPGQPGPDNRYFLIGQSRGLVCFAKVIHLQDNIITCKVSKNIFPTGLTCFTILDNSHNPITDCDILIDHKDNLNINLTLDKTTFSPRDSIALHIKVTDNEGKPVVGSFSLAVTDQSQVANNLNNENPITAYLQFTSELKGEVENPAFYFSGSKNAGKIIQADSVERSFDQLMLTRGRIAYPWDKVFNFKNPEFEAEIEFMIHGKVSNTFKGIPKTKVLLYTRNPLMMKDTLTDQDGCFTFKNLRLRDTASYIIQSFNRNGKSFLNTVVIDEFKPPQFTAQTLTFNQPLNTIDSTLLKPFADYHFPPAKEKPGLNDIHQLGEVVVTANKTVKGSKSLNGPGNADQVLNTQDLQKLGKTTLLELLRKQIKGFRIKDLDKYYINDYPIKLVMDGLYVDTYDGLFADAMYDPLKENFEYFKAEDISGIEVMTSPRYNSIYNTRYLSSDEVRTVGGASGKDYAWLEITTRAGRGAYMKRTAGVVSYKPMPFSLPKQFYSPRYTTRETLNTLPDLRSTIHWEPNIVTDENGTATVSFFAADRPTKYTVIIQGSDMQGNIGSALKFSFIEIKK